MREILFRGKLVYNGVWVYGGIYKEPVDDIKNGLTYIITGSLSFAGNANIIIPETVGQFTGLTDKNGKKIFEGDIVKYAEGFHHWSGAYETPTFVEYECGGFYPFAGEGEYAMSSEYAIIIGNIHDNPELLS